MSELPKMKDVTYSQQGNLFSCSDKRSFPPINGALWERLSRSAFRQKFHLSGKDRLYLAEKGLPCILEHGADFILRRLAPAHPAKDGRQTPWKGHPVFVAQHATGTCCRSCLEKWHGFVVGLPLSEAQQSYVLAVIAAWLEQEERRSAPTGREEEAGRSPRLPQKPVG